MAVQVVQVVQVVHLESDAFLVCLKHTLSTEKEEVMGLCIGELNDDPRSDSKFACTGTEMRTVAEKVDAIRIVHIHSVIILRRSGKSKDRVKISSEQLSAASTEAERLAELTGRPIRVVGWYHSHPHIIVWPSHVDVRTQAMCQMIDQEGLIFSCFIEDKNTKTEYKRIEIPIHIVPHIHNGSVFTKNLCSQMSAVSGPLLQWLEDRLEQNQQHLQELQQEKEALMQELSSLE
uniref:MPN domain-containing protein n=1 Tax=Rhinopithecus roxellana TaxID=61622 RepID=A0A2K6PH81_RHIRO